MGLNKHVATRNLRQKSRLSLPQVQAGSPQGRALLRCQPSPGQGYHPPLCPPGGRQRSGSRQVLQSIAPVPDFLHKTQNKGKANNPDVTLFHKQELDSLLS